MIHQRFSMTILGAQISSIQYTQFYTVIIDESYKKRLKMNQDFDLDSDHGSAGDDLVSVGARFYSGVNENSELFNLVSTVTQLIRMS